MRTQTEEKWRCRLEEAISTFKARCHFSFNYNKLCLCIASKTGKDIELDIFDFFFLKGNEGECIRQEGKRAADFFFF